MITLLRIFIIIHLGLHGRVISKAEEPYVAVSETTSSEPKIMRVEEGSDVTLPCDSSDDVVTYWKLYDSSGAKSYRTDVQKTLILNNVTVKDELTYECCIYITEKKYYLLSTEPLTKISLFVISKPSNVRIANGQYIEVQENIPTTLQCYVHNARPAADILWLNDTEVISAGHGISISQETLPEEKDSSKSKFMTSSTLQLVPKANENGMRITCKAVHETLKNRSLSDTTVFDVLYRPDPPRMYGYRSGDILTKGDNLNLTCKSEGGNPLAQHVWYKNAKEIPADYRTVGRSAMSTQLLTVDETDNNATYTCGSYNSINNSAANVSVTLRVNFPLTSVTIYGPKETLAGKLIKARCETGSSNPEPKIVWLVDNISVHDQRSIINDLKNAEYGGFSIKSSISLKIETNKTSLNITCSADGISDSLYVNVLRPPERPFITGYSEGTPVSIGTSVKMLCSSSGGNPSPKLAWYKNDAKLSSTHSSVAGKVTSEITVEVSYLDKYDVYKCEASSAAIDVPLTVTRKITVTYPATITHITQMALAKVGEDAHLSCEVDGYPMRREYIRWERDGYPMLNKTSTKYERNLSILTVSNVTRNDSGTFRCVVNNLIGPVSDRTAFLVVKYKPEIDFSFWSNKVASGENAVATLTCKAHGLPNVTFTWITNDGHALTPITNDGKYFLNEKQVYDSLYESKLVIRNVRKSDYGTYECRAINEMGTTPTRISLQRPGLPDTPLNLTAINVTQSTVTLTWVPQFDGGFDAEFIIRYRLANSPENSYKQEHVGSRRMYTVKNLEYGSEYIFVVAARNSIGTNPSASRAINVTTISSSESLIANAEFPLKLIFCIGATALILLLLNVCILTAFFYKRRKAFGENSDENVDVGDKDVDASKESTFEMDMYGSRRSCNSSENRGDSSVENAGAYSDRTTNYDGDNWRASGSDTNYDTTHSPTDDFQQYSIPAVDGLSLRRIPANSIVQRGFPTHPINSCGCGEAYETKLSTFSNPLRSCPATDGIYGCTPSRSPSYAISPPKQFREPTNNPTLALAPDQLSGYVHSTCKIQPPDVLPAPNVNSSKYSNTLSHLV